jgi:hypothetical protein
MTGVQRFVVLTILAAPPIFAQLTAPASSADRSDGRALALSHRYGAYTKPGNLAAGQTVVIDTPEGSITCTGGVNREFTSKNGPEGSRKPQSGVRSCHFN